MTHSEACTKLVASFEGCRYEAYPDQRGIPTIGYGHTHNVILGDCCNETQAIAWLDEDLKAADLVLQALDVNVPQNQWDALCSLVFNIGGHAFAGSTLLKLLRAGDMQGAANQFLAWDKTNGQVNAGLLRRRKAERAMFLEVAA